LTPRKEVIRFVKFVKQFKMSFTILNADDDLTTNFKYQVNPFSFFLDFLFELLEYYSSDLHHLDRLGLDLIFLNGLH